jgi:hypothetical protein
MFRVSAEEGCHSKDGVWGAQCGAAVRRGRVVEKMVWRRTGASRRHTVSVVIFTFLGVGLFDYFISLHDDDGMVNVDV